MGNKLKDGLCFIYLDLFWRNTIRDVLDLIVTNVIFFDRILWFIDNLYFIIDLLNVNDFGQIGILVSLVDVNKDDINHN
jgi:hypothetical protein